MRVLHLPKTSPLFLEPVLSRRTELGSGPNAVIFWRNYVNEQVMLQRIVRHMKDSTVRSHSLRLTNLTHFLVTEDT